MQKQKCRLSNTYTSFILGFLLKTVQQLVWMKASGYGENMLTGVGFTEKNALQIPISL